MQGHGSPCSPFGHHSDGVPIGKLIKYTLESLAMCVRWTRASLCLALPTYAISICILSGVYVFHCNFILLSAALHCQQHLQDLPCATREGAVGGKHIYSKQRNFRLKCWGWWRPDLLGLTLQSLTWQCENQQGSAACLCLAGSGVSKVPSLQATGCEGEYKKGERKRFCCSFFQSTHEN